MAQHSSEQMTRKYYPDHIDDEPVFRRYGNRGQGYAISHDRDLPLTHRQQGGSAGGNFAMSHGSRNGDRGPEQDPNQRKRIPVAVSNPSTLLTPVGVLYDGSNLEPY